MILMLNERKNSIATNRINYLFELLETTKDAELKTNAIKMIKRIRTRYNIRLTQNQKMSFCKYCLTPYSTKIKIRWKKIKASNESFFVKNIICERCGKETKFTIKN